jgi:hypothetical protein
MVTFNSQLKFPVIPEPVVLRRIFHSRSPRIRPLLVVSAVSTTSPQSAALPPTTTTV